MKKLRTVTLAGALLVASVPSLTTTAQARGFGFHGGGGFGGFHGGGWGHGGWGHGGWGWGGVGLGLATGALIGAAIAAPAYGGYGCPYGYGYGYGCGDYAYDGYAPAAYSYGYAPVVGYGYEEPYVGYGYRHYGYRHYGYRREATAATVIELATAVIPIGLATLDTDTGSGMAATG